MTDDKQLHSDSDRDPQLNSEITATPEFNPDHEPLDADELLDKFDKDTSKLRKLTGTLSKLVTIIAIGMSLFHLYTAGFGTLLSVRQRSLHLILAFTLGFLDRKSVV